MFGANGVVFPVQWQPTLAGWLPFAVDGWRFDSLDAFSGLRQVLMCASLIVVVLAFPNSQTLVWRFEAALRAQGARAWRYAWCATGFVSTLVFVVAAINDSRGVSEFIYFNF
jgi:hypothetical protein